MMPDQASRGHSSTERLMKRSSSENAAVGESSAADHQAQPTLELLSSDAAHEPSKTAALWALAEEHLIRYGGEFAPPLIERALGCYLYDCDGRAILDFTSGQMCSTLGHNHPAVVSAIQKSCRQAIHLFSWMLSPPVIELCHALAELLPPTLKKVLLLSTGGESNEAALRAENIRLVPISMASAPTSAQSSARASNSSGSSRSGSNNVR